MKKILFTGASSFTGCWFVQELLSRGYHVTALFRHPKEHYEGVRRERVEKIWDASNPIIATFGDEKFLQQIVEKGPWDLFCHHAAEVSGYKSDDFDISAAISSNTFHAKKTLEILQCPILYTGSLFEGGEGFSACDGEDQPFSPYALSKTMTAQIFDFWAKKLHLPFVKFVIPNPFGPYEDFRYTSYLIEQWSEGKTPSVRTPDYLRDNIHISLLAKAYRDVVEEIFQGHHPSKVSPSGYAETQGKFSRRFAEEMAIRLEIECPFVLCEQTEFLEPRARTNTFPYAEYLQGQWNEQKAWDDLAAYYQERYLSFSRK